MEHTMAAGQGFRMGSARSKQEREDAGTWLEILDVDGTPLTYGGTVNEKGETVGDKPVRWRITGYYSTQFKAVSEEENAAAVARRPNGKKAKLTKEEQDAENAEVQRRVRGRMVQEWEGMLDENGEKEAPLTLDNALTVLAEARWIRERVDGSIYKNFVFFQSA